MLLQTYEDEITEPAARCLTDWVDEFWDRHFESTGETKEEALEKLRELPGKMLEMARIRRRAFTNDHGKNTRHNPR